MKRWATGWVLALAIILLAVGAVAWLKVTEHPKKYNTVSIDVSGR